MSRQEHPIWEEELMPYVDGQLDGDQATVIARHLETCEVCAGAVADARGLSKQMASWTVENASQPMIDRVLTELRSKGKRVGRTWALWNPRKAWAYGLTGALAASVLVAVLVTRNRESSNNTTLVWSKTTDDASSSLQYEVRREAPAQAPQGQQGEALQRAAAAELQQAPADGPFIIRTSHLTIVTKDFDSVRSRIEAIARQSQGYLDQLTARGEVGTARSLSASLRLPSNSVDAALVELRKIGRVQEESQNSTDVTSQYVDLRARLSNARNTEQRLLTLLRERTGKLEEVVNAERELSRVREGIEQMEAQQKNLANRVQYATVGLEISEEYRAEVEPSTPAAGTRLRNALIDGYHGAMESAMGAALFALRFGPVLLMWAVVLVPFVLLLRRRFQSARQS